VVDLYEKDVIGHHKLNAIKGPQQRAKVEVMKVRELWEVWSDSEDEEEEDLCCGYLILK